MYINIYSTYPCRTLPASGEDLSALRGQPDTAPGTMAPSMAEVPKPCWIAHPTMLSLNDRTHLSKVWRVTKCMKTYMNTTSFDNACISGLLSDILS